MSAGSGRARRPASSTVFSSAFCVNVASIDDTVADLRRPRVTIVTEPFELASCQSPPRFLRPLEPHRAARAWLISPTSQEPTCPDPSDHRCRRLLCKTKKSLTLISPERLQLTSFGVHFCRRQIASAWPRESVRLLTSQEIALAVSVARFEIGGPMKAGFYFTFGPGTPVNCWVYMGGTLRVFDMCNDNDFNALLYCAWLCSSSGVTCEAATATNLSP